MPDAPGVGSNSDDTTLSNFCSEINPTTQAPIALLSDHSVVAKFVGEAVYIQTAIIVARRPLHRSRKVLRYVKSAVYVASLCETPFKNIPSAFDAITLIRLCWGMRRNAVDGSTGRDDDGVFQDDQVSRCSLCFLSNGVDIVHSRAVE